jgi:hypothetical protein
MIVRPGFWALFVSIAAVVGCSSPGTSGGGGGGGGGSGGGGPPPGGGACEGFALECYHLSELSSCMKQQGCDWRRPTDEPGHCSDVQYPCATFAVDPAGCVAQLGCQWRNGDGTIDKLDTSRTCRGSAQPCDGIADEAVCNAQYGCWVLGSTCQRNFSEPDDCGSFNVSNGWYPSIAQSTCEARLGCTWSAAGGP